MKKLSSKTVFGAFVVACVIFLFFLPNLLLGKIPIPADSLLGLYHPWRDSAQNGYNPGKFPTHNPLITDPVLQSYPWRFAAFENIKSGNLPLWNPYSFSGQPLLGNIQSATFQITNIFFFLLPFKIAWAISVIAPSILTGIFMFLFLKELKLSQAAAIFGALVLPFTGFFIAWLTWGTIITTAMWLPLILLSLLRLSKKVSWQWFLVLTLSVFQTIVSGHWQTALYVLVASFIYLVMLHIENRSIKWVGVALVAIVAGILIAAPQILPSLEFLNYSARNIDQGYSPGRQDWFIPLQNLLQIVAPDFFGNPATYNYWGIWNYAEFVSFIGVLPFALALLVLFKLPKTAKFFAALAFLSLLFGLENPIAKIPYLLKIPLVSSMQPSRIIVLLVFSLSALAAFGLEYFLNARRSIKLFISPIVISLILVAIALYVYLQKGAIISQSANIDPSYTALRNLILPILTSLAVLVVFSLKIIKVPNKILLCIIFLLTIFELFRFGQKFTPFSKPSSIFPPTDSIEFLQEQERPFRVMATDRRILHPNSSTVYKIESIDGYDPLFLNKYGQFISSLLANEPSIQSSGYNRIITPQKFDSPLIKLLNVRYILTFDELNEPGLVKVKEEGETKIYQNQNALPRIFFVNEVKKVDTPEEELAHLLDSNFNVVIQATSQEFAFKKEEFSASIDMKSYSDQSFVFTTQTDSEVPIIIGNINYPGWQAKIDGVKTTIREANFMFQSIMVPAGEHEVQFKFVPKSFYNGLYLSAVGIALTFAATAYLWRKKSA